MTFDAARVTGLIPCRTCQLAGAVFFTKAKEASLPYYLPIAGEMKTPSIQDLMYSDYCPY